MASPFANDEISLGLVLEADPPAATTNNTTPGEPNETSIRG
jgi:hypothetical protein